MRDRSSEVFILSEIMVFCVRNLSTDKQTNRSTAAMHEATAIGGIFKKFASVQGQLRSRPSCWMPSRGDGCE